MDSKDIKALIMAKKIAGGSGGDTRFKSLVEGTITSINDTECTSICANCFRGLENLQTVSMENVTEVNDSAFYACKVLNVSLPKCESLANHAFYGTNRLENVSIPKVTSLGDSCFATSYISTLDCPKVVSIGAKAFDKSNLSILILRSAEMCVLANANALASLFFKSGGAGGTVYVPQSLLATYQADSIWSSALAANANNQILAIEGSPYELT